MRPLAGMKLLAATAGLAVAAIGLAVSAKGPAGPGIAAGGPAVLATYVVPAVPLPGGVALGGLSDLFIQPVTAGSAGGDSLVAWTITDRGPNGSVGDGDARRRTLLAPDFSPALIRLEIPGEGETTVKTILPLAGAAATPFTGRANGIGRDEPMLDAESGVEIAADPNGVDPEGLVVMPDGSFWVSEEYRPSLMKVSADGRVSQRHVPAGVELSNADTRVIADLPAVYGSRRDNRGFEGLARSPDGTRLFVLLQSPLDHPEKKAAKRTGNVRMLVVDAASGEPVAEHCYRMGNPAVPGWAAKGAPPDDGKLCCLAPLADGGLLVLEQDDTGIAMLYRADPAAATDTLPRTLANQADSTAAAEPLETIGDLAAAGIRPVAKTLVADLGSLVPRLRRDVFGDDGSGGGAKLKLEGLAVLDDRRLLLVNDNDFAAAGSTAGDAGRDAPAARSCLWMIGLPIPLLSHDSLTVER